MRSPNYIIKTYRIKTLPPLRCLLLFRHPHSLWDVPEADVGVFVPLEHQSEAITALAHLILQQPGHIDGVVYQVAVLSISTGLQHQPELKGVYFATALDALVARVVGNVVELVLLEQIMRLGTVASLQKAILFPGEKERALHRHPQRLVGIPGKGVGPFQTSQQRSILMREQDGSSKTSIHMEPQTMPLRHVGCPTDVIEGSQYGGTGSTIDKERLPTTGFRLHNLGLQVIQPHLTPSIGLDSHAIVTAQSQPVGRLDEAVVRLVGCEQHQWLHSEHSGRFDGGGELVASQNQAVHVGSRATGTKDSITVLVAGQLADSRDQFSLNQAENGGNFVGIPEGIEKISL